MTDLSWPEAAALAVVGVLIILMLWRVERGDASRKRDREEMKRHLKE